MQSNAPTNEIKRAARLNVHARFSNTANDVTLDDGARRKLPLYSTLTSEQRAFLFAYFIRGKVKNKLIPLCEKKVSRRQGRALQNCLVLSGHLLWLPLT